MIFIKNYVEELKGADVKIAALKEGNKTTVMLSTENDKVDLVTTKIEGVFENIRNSIKYIGDITKDMVLTDEFISSSILDKKPTEIAFFLKGTKMVLTETRILPNEIGIYEESPENKKHYPRDMIVMIVPREVDGKPVQVNVVMDKRNLGADIKIYGMDKYEIICLYIKWPTWANLKFPAYGYLTLGEDRTPWKAFKLGCSKIKIKGGKSVITKNQIEEVPVEEAKTYLDESFKLMREKQTKSKPHDQWKNGKTNTHKPQNNNYEKHGHHSEKSYGKYNDRTQGGYKSSFPSKFKSNSNKGGYNNSKSGNGAHKNFNRRGK